MTPKTLAAIAVWGSGRSTGASAKCIAAHMLGQKTDGSYPHDGGDFNRCETLLDAAPELRGRMHEMTSVNKYWEALVPKWEEIRGAPDAAKYDAIQSIVRPLEKKDPSVVHLGEGVSMKFGSR